MSQWISEHASQILLVIITAVVYKLIDLVFAKRAKVVWFYTNSAAFHMPLQGGNPPLTIYTHTLALQNLGRAPAEQVKVVHNFLPDHYQVFPPQQTAVEILPGGQRALVIPRILPYQIVYVSYLYNVPALPNMYSHVEAKDHIANPMPVQINRRFPNWANWIFALLILLGTAVVLYYFYAVGTGLLKLLGSK